MPKYICKVLLEGSIDALYDEITSILNDVFKYIDSTKRFNTFQELMTPQPIINVYSKKYEKLNAAKRSYNFFIFFLPHVSVWLRQHG